MFDCLPSGRPNLGRLFLGAEFMCLPGGSEQVRRSIRCCALIISLRRRMSVVLITVRISSSGISSARNRRMICAVETWSVL
jgi:hypothetical protein